MRYAWTGTVVVAAGLAASCGGGSSPSTPTPTPVPTPAPTPDPTARYSVTFDAAWEVGTHPTDFPVDAHFSRLIGGTHSARVAFWTPGALASAGIEMMAERGRTSPLDAEVEAAIAEGTAFSLIEGGGIALSPGSVATEFDIGRDHSLVTLVSMVAPSPDWFVGVSGLALIENGQWLAEKTVTLYPWDAGTDDGATYASKDRDTRPPRPIALLDGPPVAEGGEVAPFGTFTFRRLE